MGFFGFRSSWACSSWACRRMPPLPASWFDKLTMSRRKDFAQALRPQAYPVSLGPSLRAERGNLAMATGSLPATRSPCRCAPRDDKAGTRQAVPRTLATQRW